ncbi:adenylate/guanylate cyclase domain-containing protein [Undibacterium sp. LX40W]|uniref:Adenylate/guanylate cyclase domain-containing protein n=1 Tax=Undibacterium nitidum TaxID=2762298 RepID=A0A923HV66_9BURK|nr:MULTISPECIES: adenylate/guanylate cyclase domain-containing protein [Undibacterium]MBC3883282.1 adenylate/guanylate cyclase domain-containing protein [Undibacterium nitidum]MBC3893571.1 adenylate/guanylate cyclase domain-containing protein [Undibacterium sp. LX40W]
MTIATAARNRWARAALIAFQISLVIGSALLLSETRLGQQIDYSLYDRQLALSRQYFPQAVSIDPVIVGLDEAFVDSIDEPLSLSHTHLAQALEIISSSGARVIGVDIALPEKRFETLVNKSAPELDLHRRLLQGLLTTVTQSKLVVAKVWDKDAHHFRELQLDYAAVLQTQEGNFDPMASAHLCADLDGKIRRFPDHECQPDRINTSLAAEVAAAYGVRQNWQGLINFRLGSTMSYRSLKTILQMHAQGDQIDLRHLFDGKVVLVGSTQDYVDILHLPAPLARWLPDSERVPGVLVHAQAVRSMLNQGMMQSIANTSWQVILLCLIASTFLFGRRIALKLSLAFIAILGLACLSFLMFLQNRWLSVSAVLLTLMFASLWSISWQAWQHFVDKQKLAKAFTGRVSPQVMSAIMENDVGAMQHSHREKVCVLFSDVRNFTTMCEHMPAEQVVNLLNRYFSLMVAEIHKQGGTVDKFIGDGLMAFFGAPNTLLHPEQQALKAARGMLVALEDFNREISAQGFGAWKIGIGLHAGEAVIGILGSEERHEYTAIGDVVNTAARLESISKNLQYPIIVSDIVASAVGPDPKLVPLNEQELKGRSAIAVFGSAD